MRGKSSDSAERRRVVVAGGGVAALETVLALQELAGQLIEIELITPADHFVYRPLQVLEPFEVDPVVRLPWAQICAERSIRRIPDELSLVDPDERLVRTSGGYAHSYDALVIAVGATARQAVAGAITVGAPGATYTLRQLLGRLRSGAVRWLSFVCPHGCSWTLAIYELALLTARAAGDAGVCPQLTLLTAESQPLEVLGSGASELMRSLLDEHDIELRTRTTAEHYGNRRLTLHSGEDVVAEAVVALPRLEGPSIGGLRCTPAGFVKVGEHGLVDGEDCIYAAGDATDFPIKQGGLAAQQADAVAAHIAVRAGATARLEPAAPVLRAALLTGAGSRYLRRELGDALGGTEIRDDPIWWPPAKIAGRHLAPYLAAHAGID
jgi:sulfide:quinone oxidoreductase